MRFIYIFLVFACAMISCVNDPAKVNKLAPKNALPVQTAHDVDLLYSDSARLKMRLTAPQVDEYAGNKPYTVMPKGVHVQFFNDSGKTDSYLTAKYAVRRESEHTMEASGNVELLNTEGKKLNTERLYWDGSRRRIYTDAFVTITTADQVIMGTGLEADDMLENYTIKNITGTFLLNE
jgi:LPS export ABC transporter protein LptC